MEEQKFDLSFQVGLLSSALQGTRNFNIIKSSLGELNAFDNSAMKFIWHVCSNYHKSIGSIPDRSLIEIEAKENGDNLELCAEVSAALDLIYKHAELNNSLETSVSYAYKASEYANALRIDNLIKNLEKDRRNSNYESAFEKIANFQRIDIANDSSFDIIDWHESFKERFDYMKKQHDSGGGMIKTGIMGIDNVLKGIEMKSMFVILGITNRGKTALGNFIAYNQALDKTGTIYYSGEMHASRIARRIDARHTLIDGLRFKTFDFSKTDQEIIKDYYNRRADDFNGYIKIVSASDNVLPGQIKQHGLPIESVFDTYEKNYKDVKNLKSLFIDSFNHIRFKTRKYKTKMEMFYDASYVLDGFFETVDLVGWVLAQSNRGGKTKTDNETVGETYELTRCADYVLAINEPQKNTESTNKEDIPESEDYKGGVLEVVQSGAEQREQSLDLTKTRDSGQFSTKVKGILSRMLYVDDGYLNAENDILGNKVI